MVGAQLKGHRREKEMIVTQFTVILRVNCGGIPNMSRCGKLTFLYILLLSFSFYLCAYFFFCFSFTACKFGTIECVSII